MKFTMRRWVNTLLALVLTVLLTAAGLPLSVHSQSSDKEIDPGSKRLAGDVPDSFYSDTDVSFSAKKVDSSANPYTGSTYTHNEAFDDTPIVNGIDVSEFNTITDWNAVRDSGITFVIVRAAYRAAVSGNLLNDSNYQKNIEGALAAGLKVGLYIYSQATTEEEARQEADYLVQHVGSYSITMPLVLDYEYYSETGPTHGRLWDANLTKAQATAVCKAFCQRITEYGYAPMVYANANMLTNHLDGADLSGTAPIWMAAYTTKSSYSGSYEFWQYSSKGSVPGITGNVDMDFWYTSDVTKYETKFTVSGVTDLLYTGQPLVPTFTVSFAGTVLTQGVDYTYTLENNTQVGTATLHVQGLGNYASYNKDVTFQIKSPQITGFGVSASTKTSLTLSWEALSGATGYTVFRSRSQNGSLTQVASLSGDVLQWKDSGCKSGTEYYYVVTATYGAGGAQISSERVVGRTKNAQTRKVQLKKKYALRTATKASASKVISVPAGGVAKIVADASTKSGTAWYYVSYQKNGKTYYGYLPKSKGTLYRYARTTTKHVNLRKGAGTSKRLVAVIRKKKTKVTVIGQKKVGKTLWYKVNVKQGKYSYKGFVHGKYIKFY